MALQRRNASMLSCSFERFILFTLGIQSTLYVLLLFPAATRRVFVVGQILKVFGRSVETAWPPRRLTERGKEQSDRQTRSISRGVRISRDAARWAFFKAAKNEPRCFLPSPGGGRCIHSLTTLIYTCDGEETTAATRRGRESGGKDEGNRWRWSKGKGVFV